MTVSDRFSSSATHELSVLVSVEAASGGSASLVAISAGSHVLADTCGDYLGRGYIRKLVEYPIFDLRLLERCLQKVSSSAFGSLDPHSKKEVFIIGLKGAKKRDSMMSHFGLCRVIVTGELSMPSFLEVNSNIVGVLPLIVVYLKETGRKFDGENLVLYYILHFL